MGLTLEFYVGDGSAIRAAVESWNLDQLDEPGVIAHCADLSLHIVPKDLDLLSRAMASVTGLRSLDLRPNLEVLVDGSDGGLFAVNPAWTAYAAAVPVERVPDVAAVWVDSMRRQYGDEVSVNEDLLAAVQSLVLLCRAANSAGHQVLHLWYP